MMAIFVVYYLAAKRMLRTVILAFAIMGLWSVLHSCSETAKRDAQIEPVALRFNLHTDSTYKYIIDSRLTLQPEVNGQTLKIEQNIKLVTSFHVLNANRFGRNVMINYDRIVMGSANGGTANSYDSDDSSTRNPLFAQVAMQVNKPYKLLIKDNGIVMTSSDTDSSMYSDSSMRKMVMECLNVYPPNAVKPGDSWKKHYNTSSGLLHMHVANTYVLNGVKDNIAHIDINGQITPEDTLQNMAFKGVQSGNLDIDLATGVIISSKLSQQLSGTIKVGNRSNVVNATAEISIVNAK